MVGWHICRVEEVNKRVISVPRYGFSHVFRVIQGDLGTTLSLHRLCYHGLDAGITYMRRAKRLQFYHAATLISTKFVT